MSLARQLEEKIDRNEALVAVVGVGYVGLPLAVEVGHAGLKVVCIDVSAEKVRLINEGTSYIADVPTEQLAPLVKKGLLRATTDFDILKEVDAVSVCVPTPLGKTKDPDMSMVLDVADKLQSRLKKGALVILESTTYPGTTREIFLPRLSSENRVAGEDFFLAFSPERVDPGNPKYNTKNTPKIIGGTTPNCSRVAKHLYSRFIDTIVPVSSTDAAEMVKLLENTFRAVNIGLVNEVAIMCQKLGIDTWEVIHAAATKPFGFMPFFPGPGLGGHCLIGTETVRVRGRGLDTLLPLEDLFLFAQIDAPVQKVGDLEVIEPKGVETLSLDPQTGTSAWKKISHLFKRPFQGKMVRVCLRGNRTITTTDLHPMLVVEGDKLVERHARDLKIGDRVPQFNLAPSFDEAEDPSIDLLSYFDEEVIQKLHVRIQGIPWSRYASLLKSRFGWKIRDAIRKDSLSASQYLEIETEIGADRSQLLLLSGRGAAHSTFPAVLPITPDFCRLLGYYLSEGCITEERNIPRVRLTFNRDEAEHIQDASNLLGALGQPVSVYQPKQLHATTLRAGSMILGHVLRDVLLTGRASHKMRVPAVVMAASARHHQQLLSGLLRGDGDVEVRTGLRTYRRKSRVYRHQFNTGSVGYFSSNPELFMQAESLLQGLRFRPARKRNKPHLRMTGTESLRRLESFFDGEKAERLKRLASKKIRTSEGSRDQAWRECNTLEVTEIQIYEDAQTVYSVEVPETHTFATTGGIFVHNCIPVDPLYLSWKLKMLKYNARFIELADEINSSMPPFVVQRAQDILNDAQKALKGSKVLLLGMAYKRDIDDVRESPALDIYELLHQKGAHVDYYDPYVPKIRMPEGDVSSVSLSQGTGAYDLIIITTDHKVFDYEKLLAGARLVFDTRNALGGRSYPGIKSFTL